MFFSSFFYLSVVSTLSNPSHLALLAPCTPHWCGPLLSQGISYAWRRVSFRGTPLEPGISFSPQRNSPCPRGATFLYPSLPYVTFSRRSATGQGSDRPVDLVLLRDPTSFPFLYCLAPFLECIRSLQQTWCGFSFTAGVHSLLVTMALRTAAAGGAAGSSAAGSAPQGVLSLSSLSLQQLVGVKDQLDAVSAACGDIQRSVHTRGTESTHACSPGRTPQETAYVHLPSVHLVWCGFGRVAQGFSEFVFFRRFNSVCDLLDTLLHSKENVVT